MILLFQEAKWGYRRTMGAMFAYSNQADRMLMSYNCQVQQYARSGHARANSRMSLIQCIRLDLKLPLKYSLHYHSNGFVCAYRHRLIVSHLVTFCDL